MAVNAFRRDVTTTATLIYNLGTPVANAGIAVYNAGPTQVFLGGPTVTTATGIVLGAGTTFSAAGFNSVRDPLYAISASGTQTCQVMVVGS